MQTSNGQEEEWNLWKEREFIEPLANQRLYFFLVFITVIVVGVMTVQCKPIRLTVLIFGGIISYLFAITIFRGFKKIDYVMSTLQIQQASHEVVQHWKAFEADPTASRCLSPNDPKACLSNTLLGQWIPWLCLVFLFVLTIVILSFS